MADAAATGGPARWWNLKQLIFKCWSHDTYDGRWSHPMCWLNGCSVVSWNHLISYFSSECAWLATVWSIFLVWILYVAGPLSYVACLGCSPCLGFHRSIHELTDVSTHFSQWPPFGPLGLAFMTHHRASKHWKMIFQWFSWKTDFFCEKPGSWTALGKKTSFQFRTDNFIGCWLLRYK